MVLEPPLRLNFCVGPRNSILKHNLNAQDIGSLRTEFSTLKGEIDGLIKSMNEAIQTSNQFIAEIKP